MKRIMIIGCSGAGKSTLARQLHQQLGLEVLHLDQYYLKANWEETPREEWEEIVDQLIQKKAWIMDGNYGGTMDRRIAVADTIIFLNYPTTTCLRRALHRTWKYYGQSRPELNDACKERYNLPFLWYILRFKRTRTPGILQKLAQLSNSKQVFVLNSDREKEKFLAQIDQ